MIITGTDPDEENRHSLIQKKYNSCKHRSVACQKSQAYVHGTMKLRHRDIHEWEAGNPTADLII